MFNTGANLSESNLSSQTFSELAGPQAKTRRGGNGLPRRKPFSRRFRRSVRRSTFNTARGDTVSYMCPEQFVTGASSEQTDVFALGVMIYRMVTGVHPFFRFGDAPEEIAHRIQYADPDPPRVLRQDLPAEFEGVVMKALAKQPSERYDSRRPSARR